MGIEKKAALVCVVVLAALFGIGLATSKEHTDTETARARLKQDEAESGGFILPDPAAERPKGEKKRPGPGSKPDPIGSDDLLNDFREVEVKARDNYTKIAARELGDRNLHPLIKAANPGVDPRRLKIGQKIRVPKELPAGGGDLEEVVDQIKAENTLGGVEYKIKKGESLSTIANRVYGKESRWRDIWAANRGVIGDPNRVRSGITIVLP